jgi:glutathione S-transferase
MIELYNHSTSVCAAKVRLVLKEKGIEWTSRYVDLLAGEQFAPDYVKLNPKAVVPTLVHDGRVIRESTVINEYLDEVFPEPALKPATPEARAHMRVWTKLVDEVIHPACTDITYATQHRHTILAMPPAERAAMLAATPNPEWRERKRRLVEEGFDAPFVQASVRAHGKLLDEMEAALADAPWLAGATYSLADIAVTPYVNRLYMFGLDWMWVGRRPRVADWFARIRSRDSYFDAVISWIVAETSEAMMKNGQRNRDRYRAILDAA